MYSLYILSLFATITLAVLHTLALSYKIYFYVPWFDIPMHILGGFVVALCAIILCSLYPKKIPIDLRVILVILFTLLIGSLWEVFEVYLNAEYQVEQFSFIDTISDLWNDFVGSVLALVLGYTVKWYEK